MPTPAYNVLSMQPVSFPKYSGRRGYLPDWVAHTLDAMQGALRLPLGERTASLADYAGRHGIQRDINGCARSVTMMFDGKTETDETKRIRPLMRPHDRAVAEAWDAREPTDIPWGDEVDGTGGDESPAQAPQAAPGPAAPPPKPSEMYLSRKRRAPRASGRPKAARSKEIGDRWLEAAIAARTARMASGRSPRERADANRMVAERYGVSAQTIANLGVPLRGHCRALAARSLMTGEKRYRKELMAAKLLGRWPSNDVANGIAAVEAYAAGSASSEETQAKLDAAWIGMADELGKTMERISDADVEFAILDAAPEEGAADEAGKGGAPAEGEGPDAAAPAEESRPAVPEPEDPAIAALDEFAKMAVEATSRHVARASLRLREAVGPRSGIETIHATDGRGEYQIMLIRPGLTVERYEALSELAVAKAAYNYLGGSNTVIAVAEEADDRAISDGIKQGGFAGAWVFRMAASFRPVPVG